MPTCRTIERAESGDEREVQGRPGRTVRERCQCLGGEHPGGRSQREPDGEEDDLARRRAPHGEELGVLTQEVEERLRDGDRPENREMDGAEKEHAPGRLGRRDPPPCPLLMGRAVLVVYPGATWHRPASPSRLVALASVHRRRS